MSPKQTFDEVGFWTEIKLRIIEDYSKAYAIILSKKRVIKHFAFIDGFAGTGTNISKTTGKEIDGSASIALNVEPKFSHYHLIDMNGKSVKLLEKLRNGRSDVSIYEGDCNTIFL